MATNGIKLTKARRVDTCPLYVNQGAHTQELNTQLVLRVELLVAQMVHVGLMAENRLYAFRCGQLYLKDDDAMKYGISYRKLFDYKDAMECGVIAKLVEEFQVHPLYRSHEHVCLLLNEFHVKLNKMYMRRCADLWSLKILRAILREVLEEELWGVRLELQWDENPDRSEPLPQRAEFGSHQFLSAFEYVCSKAGMESSILMLVMKMHTRVEVMVTEVNRNGE